VSWVYQTQREYYTELPSYPNPRLSRSTVVADILPHCITKYLITGQFSTSESTPMFAINFVYIRCLRLINNFEQKFVCG